ncbi:MAG: Gfo/Idh/MocA family protein [Fimbriimonas sp.]
MKWGVIGWGLRKSLAKIAHAPDRDRRLVALADPDPERQAEFLEFAGPEATVTADFRELLHLDLDGIFVLSPDWLHEEQAIACLEAGVPVYLEKPMAITVEGCDRILEAAERTGTKLYLGHNMRHFAVVLKMKEWIDAGKIGEVQTAWCRHFVSYGGEAYFKDWHAERERSTGLLLQKGAHDLDVIHWLCGGYSKRVTAMGALKVYGDIADRQAEGERVRVQFTDVWPPRSLTKLNPVIDVEDLSMMLMELDNGVHASYQHCMFSPDAWRNYTVIGTEGRIENIGDAPGRATVKLWNRNVKGFAEADEEWAVPAATGGHGGADEGAIEEFLRYVRDGVVPTTSPIAARMAVAAAVAGTESLRNGSGAVDVKGLR